MARTYLNKEQPVEHETSITPLHATSWLVEERKNFPNIFIWKALLQKGTLFEDALLRYPETLPRPTKTERGFCHDNNLAYAELLAKTFPKELHRFRFVTGLWVRERKVHLKHEGATNYSIGGHSFMTFDSEVIDIMTLTHPQDFYTVTERFGIAFTLEDVLNTFYDIKEKAFDATKIPLIEVLIRKPYL